MDGHGSWSWILGGRVFGGGIVPFAFRGGERVNSGAVTLTRSSGILLHPTSLPSGKLHGDAYRCVDWLATAEQSWWQVLPLGPPDATGSPYQAHSAFAGWPGLLAKPDAAVSPGELD